MNKLTAKTLLELASVHGKDCEHCKKLIKQAKKALANS